MRNACISVEDGACDWIGSDDYEDKKPPFLTQVSVPSSCDAILILTKHMGFIQNDFSKYF